jgi:hypothetical protein
MCFAIAGLAVRFMTCAVRPSCPVVKVRVSLASGVYTGDWFQIGQPTFCSADQNIKYYSVVDPTQFFSDPDPIFVRVLNPDSDPL